MEALKAWRSDSPETTREVARDFAGLLRGGELIGLTGELGAGKTEFVRGVAEALGAIDSVSSPTYVLEHVYPLRALSGSSLRELHHWDLYRLNERFDLAPLEELSLQKNVVSLIEWPEKVPGILPLLSVHIEIIRDGEQARRIKATPC